ncbi:hypothetical protein EYF80_049959 [Liparis tanakae]|uniref:Uncharacterized protein n=1 Tax=Liparis tanakae TaxID=230148 RepID=A0A4Z2FFB6_9TELE|nr:hypothetical protein EYF80_049959 [Liparis tanakae]
MYSGGGGGGDVPIHWSYSDTLHNGCLIASLIKHGGRGVRGAASRRFGPDGSAWPVCSEPAPPATVNTAPTKEPRRGGDGVEESGGLLLKHLALNVLRRPSAQRGSSLLHVRSGLCRLEMAAGKWKLSLDESGCRPPLTRPSRRGRLVKGGRPNGMKGNPRSHFPEAGQWVCIWYAEGQHPAFTAD